jgi:hypothetical protein
VASQNGVGISIQVGSRVQGTIMAPISSFLETVPVYILCEFGATDTGIGYHTGICSYI